MKRKLIAVDLDDVLADSAAQFVQYSNKKWGTNLTVDDFSEHWATMWGIDLDETLRRREQIYAEKVQVNLGAYNGAHEVLKRLAQNFDLVIVTSRPTVLQKDTMQWLETYYKGIFTDVIFAGIWDGDDHPDQAVLRTKAHIIKRLGANYFIDDHPKHCFAVAAEGIPSLLYGDYAWNRSVELPEHVERVADWGAVEEYFNGLGE